MSDRFRSEFDSPIRLMLVVRHEGLRADIARSLTASGYDVEVKASLPLTGFDSPGARPADVLVLDFEVYSSASDGSELTAMDPDRIIWLAGAEAASSQPRGRVLSKPFSIHTLEEAIRDCLVEGDMPLELHQDPLLRSREPNFLVQVERARRLARENMPLVFEGELGTGRRALARAAHRLSPRGQENCRALDRAEVEANGRAGMAERIEVALTEGARGTLILVEPAEWTVEAQQSLCAALRSKDSNPNETPRLFTVTRTPLEESGAQGELELELQYRLDGNRIALLPLRDRPLDHTDLCLGIARRLARSLGCETPPIEESLVAALAAEGFPGNGVGLESRLRSALLRGEPGQAIHEVRRDVEAAKAPASAVDSLDLKSLERDTIVRALAHWQGNRTRASESLGISVRTLRNKIRDYGLR